MNEHATANGARAEPGKWASISLSVLMHLGLLAVLIYGIHWQTQRPEAVEVELVRSLPPAPVPPRAAAPPQPAPEPPPKPEPKPELPPPPKVEPKPAPKPDIALPDKPKPEPKPEPKPAPKPEPRPAPKPEPKPAPKPEPKPAPDRTEQLLQEELRAQRALQQEQRLAQELAAARSVQSAAASNRALADWQAKVRARIRARIVLPPALGGNPEAVIEVTQIPLDGTVLDVRLVKSSGNAALDAAIERAIRGASPLPLPARAELAQRVFNIKYRPFED